MEKPVCSYRMEDLKLDWFDVIWVVKGSLVDIFSQQRKFRKIHVNDQKILKELNCPVAPLINKIPKIVAWKKPIRGVFKLNMDGCSMRNPGEAGGGGVIRDAGGNSIVGFTRYYGVATNTLVEGCALLDGLRLAKHLG